MDQDRYMTGRAVCKRLGVCPVTLVKLVERREVAVLKVPGANPKYLRSSVEALIARSLVRADAEDLATAS